MVVGHKQEEVVVGHMLQEEVAPHKLQKEVVGNTVQVFDSRELLAQPDFVVVVVLGFGSNLLAGWFGFHNLERIVEILVGLSQPVFVVLDLWVDSFFLLLHGKR